jgi:hypothetical protein
VRDLLAKQIDRVAASDLPEEVAEPEPERGTTVVQGDAADEMLDLVIDTDYDGDLVRTKIRGGFHAAWCARKAFESRTLSLSKRAVVTRWSEYVPYQHVYESYLGQGKSVYSASTSIQ